jgi:hypothetical protein
MPTHLKRAARFRAHAVTCLTNAEAAPDEKTRRAHLAVAKHFYLLAGQEISQRETKQRRASASLAPSVTPKGVPSDVALLR